MQAFTRITGSIEPILFSSLVIGELNSSSIVFSVNQRYYERKCDSTTNQTKYIVIINEGKKKAHNTILHCFCSHQQEILDYVAIMSPCTKQ